MSVCFSTRSSLRSQRKEREKGGKMSLFPLKKHSLSLSLSLSLSALSLSLICFGCRFVFFSSLLHFVSFWVKNQALVFSLSFFPWGDRKTHHPFVSLSLSLKKSAFWKTRSPLRTAKRERERERSSLRKKRSTPPINSRAKEAGEKKDGLDFSSHCGTNRSHTEESRRRVKDENACTSENKSVRACYLASAPAGHASKIHSPVALIYVCVCVYILKMISL